MDPAAILALISDLYGQIAALQRENAELRRIVQAVEVEGQEPADPAR